MKLSELTGKKQIKVVGRLMVLAEGLSDDENFKAFLDGIKGEERERALFKLGPLLERDDIADDIVSIVAYAKGLTEEEADKLNILAEVTELLTDDIEMTSFLSEQQ